jgi:hypothetical protein
MTGEPSSRSTSADANRLRNAILTICLANNNRAGQGRLGDALKVLVEATEREQSLLLPHPALLARGLTAGGLTLPKAGQRRLQAAALRDEKRSAIAANQAEQLDALFQRHAIALHPLRGWHFASLHYPEPLARHCHALRWLVPADGPIEPLVTLLADEGWSNRIPSPLLAPHKIVLAGNGRIDVELHTQPFPWTERRPLGGAEPSSAFTAIELIGAPIVEARSRSGLWLVDLAQLLRRHRIDEAVFADMAGDYGIAATAGNALDTLADLADPDESPLQDQIAHLRAALGKVGGQGAHDAPAVIDLEIVQSMAIMSPARLVLKALRRPDLLAASYALRRQRSRRFQKDAEMRQLLREHHIANRP